MEEQNTGGQMPRQPKTIFEQILFGVQIVNDNLVALSEENAAQRAMIEELRQALIMPPIPMENTETEPNAPGAETEE